MPIKSFFLTSSGFFAALAFNLLISASLTSILSIRITSGDRHQLLLRVDIEKDHIVKDFFNEEEGNEVNYKYPPISDFDLIIVSDYAKGAVTQELLSALLKLNVPLLVDPKKLDYKGIF